MPHLRNIVEAYHSTFQKLTRQSKKDAALNNVERAQGCLLDDRYTILKALPSGQQGVPRICRSHTTGKIVVIKAARAEDPRFIIGAIGYRRKLPAEARLLLLKLEPHENIVRLFLAKRDPTYNRGFTLYFEHCSGGDLLDQMKRWKALRVPTPTIFTLHVFVSLALALAYCHHGLNLRGDGGGFVVSKVHKTIIHGDIKPDNIFLRFPGRQVYGMPDVVLGDFGLAQLEKESCGIRGTEPYFAPEVLEVHKICKTDPSMSYDIQRTKRIVTTKSDIYQVGLVVYLLAAQKRWVRSKDPSQIALPQAYSEVVGFTAALTWCLQTAPRDRPDCTTNRENGFSAAVEMLMRQRGRLFNEHGPVDARTWKCRTVDYERWTEKSYDSRAAQIHDSVLN